MNSSNPFVSRNEMPSYLPEWLAKYVIPFETVYEDTLDYLFLAVYAISYVVGFYFITGFFTYFLLRKNILYTKKRVLFIIAHPDDEVMFFGPTIVRLVKTCDIYVLCLSTGNYQGLGDKRKVELWNSCRTLGISMSNITLISSSRLPDRPTYLWSSKTTSKVLLKSIESLKIDEVYTFDIGGVSGHLNHVAIYYAFATLCLEGRIPDYCKVFLLDSINTMRKYGMFVDVNLSGTLFKRRTFMVTLEETNIIRNAMRRHCSQQTWYRKVYMYLSRYVYINTYKELEAEDALLEIQAYDSYNP